MVSSFNLKHNKYTSTPDWFKDSKSIGDSVAGSGTNYGGAVIGSTYNTVDYSEIPIDNSTIVWQDEKLAVPIDNSTIIINDEKLSVPIDNDTIIIKDGKLVVSFDENDLLDNYVTVKGDLDIEGVKNFKPGVLIDGIEVTKPQDDVIYIDGNLVVKGGVTMYADDGNVDVPSLYEGIPIDGETLFWEEDTEGNKVLKANSGTIKKIETDGKGNAITSVTLGDDNSTLLFHKNGEFAYQSQVDIISDNLDELDTEFHEFKDYAETYYVTVHTEQEIYGKKDFTTGGLFVNGSLIKYDKINKYWKLEGDLLVTGGITMYATDAIDIPSIIDSIPVASTSTKGLASFDPDFFSVDANGKVTFIGLTGGITDLPIATTSVKGIASFDSNFFTVSSGEVSFNGGKLKVVTSAPSSYDANTLYIITG